jgi:hypothetical protein
MIVPGLTFLIVTNNDKRVSKNGHGHSQKKKDLRYLERKIYGFVNLNIFSRKKVMNLPGKNNDTSYIRKHYLNIIYLLLYHRLFNVVAIIWIACLIHW